MLFMLRYSEKIRGNKMEGRNKKKENQKLSILNKRRPLFEKHMQYCVRCCIPETEEGTTFDELGICQACRSSEEKMHINWVERQQQLRKILEDAKEKAGGNYDCIVPISGGKDSMFQLYILCHIYDMKPLAVTFNHNWYSETGWYNLLNAIETFNVDHIMFTPNRDLVNRLAKRSLSLLGDPCWHCHAGVGAFPLHIATKFKIPLVVYGEPSAEGHGMSSYSNPMVVRREYFYDVSAKFYPDDMVCDYITKKDVYSFELPSQEEFDEAGVQFIHIGSYYFWDDERQTEFVRNNFGWRETEIEQTYKHYKSAECVMPGMHDFTCYLKRGYGRATFHANLDVRNGLLSRDEGFELVRQFDPVRPEALDYFLEITGMSEREFYETMKKIRRSELKDVDLPIYPKRRRNKERIRPFAQQIIEKFKRSAEDTVPALIHIEQYEQKPSPKPGSFFDLSIGKIVRLFETGGMSPVDIANWCIEQFNLYERTYQAWEIFGLDQLMDQAQRSERRLLEGNKYRPLEGIPVGVKDIFNTFDFPTQMGSPLWRDFTPGNDARVVFNLRKMGMVVPGKTVTAEFAVHTLGKTKNPHDTTKTPGTSSSGSAVAVATGMVPMALATQTAGSIVRPASFCGIYGCKPSFGLIPRTGILKTTDSLDTVGYFALHYDDLERIFELIRVHGENYPISNKILNDKKRQNNPQNRPWRVVFVRTHTWNDAESYTKTALIEWLNKLGKTDDVDIVEAEPPEIMQKAHTVHSIIYDKMLSNYFKKEYSRHELVSPIMNELIEHGLSIDAVTFKWAVKEQEEMAFQMDRFMKHFDIMITLSTAGDAPLREEREKSDPALMWTMTYLPVISAPVFISPKQLPFGLQLVARRYSDKLLFKFGYFLREHGLIPASSNPKF